MLIWSDIDTSNLKMEVDANGNTYLGNNSNLVESIEGVVCMQIPNLDAIDPVHSSAGIPDDTSNNY